MKRCLGHADLLTEVVTVCGFSAAYLCLLDFPQAQNGLHRNRTVDRLSEAWLMARSNRTRLAHADRRPGLKQTILEPVAQVFELLCRTHEEKPARPAAWQAHMDLIFNVAGRRIAALRRLRRFVPSHQEFTCDCAALLALATYLDGREDRMIVRGEQIQSMLRAAAVEPQALGNVVELLNEARNTCFLSVMGGSTDGLDELFWGCLKVLFSLPVPGELAVI